MFLSRRLGGQYVGVDPNADTDRTIIRFFTNFIINTEKGNNTA